MIKSQVNKRSSNKAYSTAWDRSAQTRSELSSLPLLPWWETLENTNAIISYEPTPLQKQSTPPLLAASCSLPQPKNICIHAAPQKHLRITHWIHLGQLNCSWLKSNHWRKINNKMQNQKKVVWHWMLKLATVPKSWLQNSIFRQEMHHNNILLNKLNTCKGKGEEEIHTFLSTLESFILNLYLTCNKAVHIWKNASMKRVSVHLHSA